MNNSATYALEKANGPNLRQLPCVDDFDIVVRVSMKEINPQSVDEIVNLWLAAAGEALRQQEKNPRKFVACNYLYEEGSWVVPFHRAMIFTDLLEMNKRVGCAVVLENAMQQFCNDDEDALFSLDFYWALETLEDTAPDEVMLLSDACESGDFNRIVGAFSLVNIAALKRIESFYEEFATLAKTIAQEESGLKLERRFCRTLPGLGLSS